MNVFNIFKRTYYAILFHKRTEKVLYEHNDMVCFDIYKTDWKTWYADPMVFRHEGKEWLFVEKMNMMRRKGTIAVAEINANGIGEFKEVLKEEYHLSYPTVFYKDGNIYMIPESAKEKKICLYRCVEFPYRWEMYQTLLVGGYYTDTNVVFHDNHWYLITGEMDPMIGSRTKTQIYNADLIEVGKLARLYNNQSFDYSYMSRGAGNIIKKGDELIRPTQYGDLQHYGKGMNFYSLMIGDNYEERLINTFDRKRVSISNNIKYNITGTHTYGLSDQYEIIDIQYSTIAHPIIVLLTIARKVRTLIKL